MTIFFMVIVLVVVILVLYNLCTSRVGMYFGEVKIQFFTNQLKQNRHKVKILDFGNVTDNDCIKKVKKIFVMYQICKLNLIKLYRQSQY